MNMPHLPTVFLLCFLNASTYLCGFGYSWRCFVRGMRRHLTGKLISENTTTSLEVYSVIIKPSFILDTNQRLLLPIISTKLIAIAVNRPTVLCQQLIRVPSLLYAKKNTRFS